MSLLVYSSNVSWFDLVVAIVVVAATVHGIRLGALVQVGSFVGFFIGLGIGVAVALGFVRHVNQDLVRTILGLVVVFGCAGIGGAIGRILGGWGATTMKRLHLGAIDAGVGAAIGALGVFFSLWLISGLLISSGTPWLSGQVQDSALVRTVDHVFPPVPSALSRVESIVGVGNFPSVFADLIAPSTTPVAVASAEQAAGLSHGALGSTIKVLAAACGGAQEGTAFVVAPGVVATNAHVVAGMTQPAVVVNGRSYPATAVYDNPEIDLALLRTDAPLGPALSLSTTTPSSGTPAAIVGFPENGAQTVTPAAVSQQVLAVGRDIYGANLVTRDVLALTAAIAPGDSGSPLMGANNHVLGMVFSRSSVTASLSYALSASTIEGPIARAATLHAPVSTGTCVSGA